MVLPLQILPANVFLHLALNINVGRVDLYLTGVAQNAHKLFQPALHKPAVSRLRLRLCVAFTVLQETVYLMLPVLLALRIPLQEFTLDL